MFGNTSLLRRILYDARGAVLVVAAAGLIVNILSGCDESLPPRNDPDELFAARISGHYIYSATNNGVGVTLSIVNTFDETFQETAVLDGYVRFTWQRNPALRKTVSIQGLQLTYARNYDRRTGLLTIDPGDSVTFFYFWDMTSDDGVFLPRSFSYQPYTRCLNLMIQDETEYFTLIGMVRMFEKTGITKFGPTEFKLCSYGTPYIDVRGCPGSPAGAPCD